ncbi:MAG TPA: oxaloacetate decarboxylase [Gammaproteobacteria bacterium]|nr:oxaloacetate decarboxylase [Gammaproteobacteria bacterium]
MQPSLISQGFELMLYGMGTVVAFLSLLIVSMLLMSWIIRRWFPVAALPKAKPLRTPASTTVVPQQTVRIIQAAIDQHRKRFLPDNK